MNENATNINSSLDYGINHFLLLVKRMSGVPFTLLVPRLHAALLTENLMSSVPSALVGPVVTDLDDPPLEVLLPPQEPPP